MCSADGRIVNARGALLLIAELEAQLQYTPDSVTSLSVSVFCCLCWWTDGGGGGGGGRLEP